MGKSWEIGTAKNEGLVDVLFVGSNTDLADMYRLKLELDGYQVRMASTLRNWTGARPDLVFLDLEDANGSGRAELTRLRTNRRLIGVAAILLVSESDEELEAHGVSPTPQEYLLRSRAAVGLSPLATWDPSPVPSWASGQQAH